MRTLLDEFRPHLGNLTGRDAALVGTLALVVLWLYLGSAPAFRQLIGPNGSDWAAYLYYHVNALLLLGLVPTVLLVRGFGLRPADFGLSFGDWRFGIQSLLVAIVLLTPIVWISSLDPAFQREYPLVKAAAASPTYWILWELTYLLYYIGWEIYFRGALLFGLQRTFGTAGALSYQTAISTLVHLGKPIGETLGAIPGGFLFGAVALRTRSIVWPLLAHWYMGALMDVCAHRHAMGLWP